MTNIAEKLPTQRTGRLKIVLYLSSSNLAAALITVLFTGSLALLSEAGHMLADVGGLTLALFAINHTRKPATPQIASAVKDLTACSLIFIKICMVVLLTILMIIALITLYPYTAI